MYADLDKTGSNYYSYSTKLKTQTPAPKGYEPFYISHYGRHGSRYYINDLAFKKMYDILDSADKANALTTLGKDVKNRFFVLWEDGENRAGDLTPLGVRQQVGIAERMYKNFPTVLAKGSEIDAKSTPKARCVLSMSSFCMKLKELNPSMNITMDASKHDLYYMCYENKEARDRRMSDTAWTNPFGKFHYKYIQPDRLVASIFSNAEYVQKHIDKTAFMRKLYDISCSMQSADHINISFYDVFTKEELFDNWQVQNAWWYAYAGPCPLNGSDTPYEAADLLAKIIEEADHAVKFGAPNVSLRFGHDIALMSLLALMHLDNCYVEERNLENLYTEWCDFKIIPMSANLQIVFYKKKKGNDEDVLVKFLQNENEVGIPVKSDIYPYYKWSEARDYFKSQLRRK
jgi:hypothetical protein